MASRNWEGGVFFKIYPFAPLRIPVMPFGQVIILKL
jgi:hypothetical protein